MKEGSKSVEQLRKEALELLELENERKKALEIVGLEEDSVAEKYADIPILLGQGATKQLGDEIVGRVKQGVDFLAGQGGEGYEQYRDEARERLEIARERQGLSAPFLEGAGSAVTDMLSPVGKVGTFLGSNIMEAVGQVPEMKAADIAGESLVNVASEGAMRGVGKLGRKIIGSEEKLIPSYLGATKIDFLNKNKFNPKRVFERLKQTGLYTSGEKVWDNNNKKFVRPVKSSLDDKLVPMSEEKVYRDMQAAISTMVEENANLLKNKKIPMMEVDEALDKAIKGFVNDLGEEVEGFAEAGFGVAEREAMAAELKATLLQDIKARRGMEKVVNKAAPTKAQIENIKYLENILKQVGPNSDLGKSASAQLKELRKGMMDEELTMIDAAALEKAKRLFQRDAARYLEKSAKNVPVNKQQIMAFSSTLDSLLDLENMGGAKYKKNNDLIADMIFQGDDIFKKMAGDSSSKGKGIMGTAYDAATTSGAATRTRVNLDKLLDTAPAQMGAEPIIRAPEEFLRGLGTGHGEESPQIPMRPQSSIPFQFRNIPEELIKTRLPRNSDKIMQQKGLFLGKIAQQAPELFEQFKSSMDSAPEEFNFMLKELVKNKPEFFESDKYGSFDGEILDPRDKIVAKKDVKKVKEISSLEKLALIKRVMGV